MAAPIALAPPNIFLTPPIFDFRDHVLVSEIETAPYGTAHSALRSWPSLSVPLPLTLLVIVVGPLIIFSTL